MADDSFTLFLLAVQLSAVVAIVVAVSVAAVRRLSIPWSIWFAGGLTFVASQILRLPLLGGAGQLTADAATVAVLAVVTSGLFEEGARYVALRWAVRRARSAGHGIVFGLGHGGVEALLVMLFAAGSAFVLLTAGPAILDSVQDAGPEMVEAVEAQIAAVTGLGPLDTLAAVYERALALVVHTALTMLVLRAVTGGGVRWLGIAAGAHMAVNGVVVLVAQAHGILAAEAVMTLAAAAGLLFLRAAWSNRHDWYEERPAGLSAGQDPGRDSGHDATAP